MLQRQIEAVTDFIAQGRGPDKVVNMPTLTLSAATAPAAAPHTSMAARAGPRDCDS